MRKNRINNTVWKPNNVYKLNVYQKVLVVLFIITFFGIFLMFAANMVSIMPAVSTLMIIIGVLLCVISIPLEVVVFYIGKNDNNNLESVLKGEKFKDFCFQQQLYTESLYDNRQVNIPMAEITNHGFKLTALPGIANKTLDAKEDLNNFLVQNGLNIYIVNAYAGGDGWLYFDISKNFRNDQL